MPDSTWPAAKTRLPAAARPGVDGPLDEPTSAGPSAPLNAPTLIASQGDSLREAFGRALAELGDSRPCLTVLDADIAGGTGVHHFRARFPDRFIQCGIAEQNMMAMAGGLAAVGLEPVVTGFAVFCLRAIEQVRLSIAYARRNVKIFASHPGLDVGPDGASAQCLEDLAMFRAIPGMTVVSPSDSAEMALATEAVLRFDGPVYVRTGRSPARRLPARRGPFTIGEARMLRAGRDVSLVACGIEVARALDAAQRLSMRGIDAQVIDMATLKPLDGGILANAIRETGALVTAEDHGLHGGLGSAVAEWSARNAPCPIEMVGVDDRFGESGEPEEVAGLYGLLGEDIERAALRVLERKNRSAHPPG